MLEDVSLAPRLYAVYVLIEKRVGKIARTVDSVNALFLVMKYGFVKFVGKHVANHALTMTDQLVLIVGHHT
jgi:hypothetical protein